MQCSIETEKCQGKCTGYDGSAIWKDIDKDVDRVECEICREEGHDLIDFAHDVKNIQLGKNVFRKDNFHKYVDIVNCVSNSCKTDGTC